MPSFDFDALRCAAERELSPARFAHVLGCTQEALRLADCNGLSLEERDCLHAAALLHDAAKELTLEDGLKLCRKWGIILDQDTLRCEAVIHQFTGALLAEKKYGMPPAVCRAIACHTTGSECMSAVDRILYLADLTEPGRAIAGRPQVCTVRRLAEHAPGDACYVQLCGEICRLESLGRCVHPLTRRAMEALLAEDRTRSERLGQYIHEVRK